MSIAFDAATHNQTANATSLTFAHTVTGSNPFIMVPGLCATSATLTATYAAVSLNTTSASPQDVANIGRTYNFYLLGPATGSNNVVVTRSTSGNIWSGAASYTGVLQKDQEGAASNGSPGSSSFSVSVTTVANNTWTTACIFSGSGSDSAGASTTLRFADATGVDVMDSNANQATPATVTLNASNANSSNSWSGLALSISSDAASSATAPIPNHNNLLTLGVT